MHAQIKHSLAYLQDFIPTLDSTKCVTKHTIQLQGRIKSCRCVKSVYALFVHTFG